MPRRLQRAFEIDGRPIGPNAPPYIIAELSGNHGGKLENALALVDAAAASGVDAIKIQTYRADTITIDHDGPEFLIDGGLWAGRTLYDLYEEAHTPWEWHAALFDRAKKHGVTIFSSPFDPTAIDLLEDLNAPAYKIASFEMIDIPLIKRAASTGKPMIMSTGLATLEEIQEAVQAAADGGCTQLAILHCISGYPTPIAECNLRTILDLQQRFDIPVGLSDHTVDHTASVTAVALGARVIEKHFKLTEEDDSVDAAFSLSPAQFRSLVTEANRAWSALGQAGYTVKGSETGGRDFRRSLYVVKAVKKGERFTSENVRSIRPGLGLHPRYYEELLGQCASQDLERGTALQWDHVATEVLA